MPKGLEVAAIQTKATPLWLKALKSLEVGFVRIAFLGRRFLPKVLINTNLMFFAVEVAVRDRFAKLYQGVPN